MRQFRAGEGGVGRAGDDTGPPASPAAFPSPSGPSHGLPTRHEDGFMQDAEVLEAFLDGWEPEWPRSLDEDEGRSEDARPWGEAQDQDVYFRGKCASANSTTATNSATSGEPPVPAEDASIRDNDEHKAARLAAPKKRRSPSNTWRQRQRLELLNLRETAKTLARRLQQLKLDQGIKSTLPLDERIRMAGEREPATHLVEASGASWSEIAKRESLARLLATTENTRLHNMISSQTVYARKLQRMLRQMMKDDWEAAGLTIPRGLQSPEVQYRPKDNEAVFRQLLAGLDDSYAAADKALKDSKITNLPCPGQSSHTWVDKARGIQAQILDRYRVPFDGQSTGRAVWQVMSGRPPKASIFLYAEYFDWDANTSLIGRRMEYSMGSLKVELLLRVAVRKYVEDNRTIFIQHQSVMATHIGGLCATSVDVTTRVLKGNEMLTHVLGSYPSHAVDDQFMPESLVSWERSLLHFNHAVEDVALTSTSCIENKA